MSSAQNQAMGSEILSLKKLSVDFGGVRAVSDVDMTLLKGEFVGLIGPNGAGKSTLLNLITSSVRPSSGDILYKGASIVGNSPDSLCHLGISRTFQNIRLFPSMSVFENVALGMHSAPMYSLAEAFIRSGRARKAEKAVQDGVHALLELVSLGTHANERAGSLSYGLQRRLELARAMATSPELLLLDEPAAGMNEDECGSLTTLIRRIHDEYKFTVILIEHHIKVVMDLCADSRLYVMNLGSILAEGSPSAIQNDPKVIGAYLGERKQTNGRRRRQISRSN
jgi:branched-chain amino acid transport system ATP-binding protein